MAQMVTHRPPSKDAVPVVFDSPHSGTYYPPDFGYAIDINILRKAEDTYVHELYGAGPDHGAHLIAAEFPRSYIDPNRTLDDIDETLIAEGWPEPIQMSQKARAGSGLIRRTIGNDLVPLYDRKLSLAEVRNRIENYWRPYHAALGDCLEAVYKDRRAYWHINCHSMGSVWGPPYEKAGQPMEHDFILGNRDGQTAGAEFTELVRKTLADMGYTVAVNDGMKGVAVVQTYGRPAENRHSLQIEIHRGLYMDEDTFEKNHLFEKSQRDLTTLVAAICDYAGKQVG